MSPCIIIEYFTYNNHLCNSHSTSQASTVVKEAYRLMLRDTYLGQWNGNSSYANWNKKHTAVSYYFSAETFYELHASDWINFLWNQNTDEQKINFNKTFHNPFPELSIKECSEIDLSKNNTCAIF